jgi:hypothetical protein
MVKSNNIGDRIMTIFNDDFNGATISGGWTEHWQTTGSGTTSSGVLKIHSADTGYFGCSASGSGIYQTAGYYEDFDVEIKMVESSSVHESTSISGGTGSFWGTGLMARLDDDNYIAILREEAAFIVAYKASYDGYEETSHGASIGYYSLPPQYFRIKRTGNDYQLYYADISQEYYYSRPITLTSGTCQIWIVSNNDPNKDQHWYDIDYFTTVS